MKKYGMLLAVLFLLGACQSKDLAFKEVPVEEAPRQVQQFISGVQDEEGTYAYFEGHEKVYIYLSSGTLPITEEAAYYENIQVAVDEELLKFTYDKNYTDDLQSDSLAYNVLYEIHLDKEYDYIEAFENGEIRTFNVMGGTTQ